MHPIDTTILDRLMRHQPVPEPTSEEESEQRSAGRSFYWSDRDLGLSHEEAIEEARRILADAIAKYATEHLQIVPR